MRQLLNRGTSQDMAHNGYHQFLMCCTRLRMIRPLGSAEVCYKNRNMRLSQEVGNLLSTDCVLFLSIFNGGLLAFRNSIQVWLCKLPRHYEPVPFKITCLTATRNDYVQLTTQCTHVVPQHGLVIPDMFVCFL